jgi:non-specific serine/threonine protein kinase
VLSPGQILDRLAGRLDLLKGGRDVDPRQATLRATIEWSHNILSPEERILFRRLAVFSGGWTLEAGEAIVDADVDGLQSLVEKSIVRMSGKRYRMLETIREYAVEQLEATEGSTQLRHRHARWFASFVERAERELEGAGQDAWMARLAEEHDNVRAALDRALAEDDPDLALRIAGAAATFWWVQGHWVEGRRWLNAALSHPGRQDEATRARALEGAANLDVRLWDWAAARPRADESLAISRSLGDQRAIARAHRVVGLVDWGEDDPEGFRRHTEDSASAARAAGDAWALSMALNNLGYLALAADDVDAAAPLFQEAVDLARARGDHRSEAFYLENAGLARLAQGAIDVARLDFEASLVIARRLGFLEVEATDLIGLAAIASNTGAPEHAAVLVGAADLIVEETGGRLDPVESSVRDRAVAEVERHIGHAALASTMAIGRSIRRDQVIDVALGDERPAPS